MRQSSFIVRGPLLNPLPDGTVVWHADGALATDADGNITFAGHFADLPGPISFPIFASDGIMLPPLVDAHIHIPQWPIRGRFMEGVEPNVRGGRLLAGLNRNVFPAESECADTGIAEQCIRDFLADTLAHGVVGGAAYMTVHPLATRRALEILPDTWSVGLVLMNQNCPAYLRSDESNLERDIAELAAKFGRRLIVTDRFATAVDSPLRQKGAGLARRFGLRMQTHLNEQLAEQALVRKLYPWSKNYTDVYKTDGLLACEPILAHCVRMSDGEFDEVARSPNALIAHCPTSNTLIGSGIMPLDRVHAAGVPYAICTDVGASPTTSLLAEAAQFLKVHRGRSDRATPSEAIFRITQAPAVAMGLGDRLGTFAVGRPFSFIEVRLEGLRKDGDTAILDMLKLPRKLQELDEPLRELAGPGLDVGKSLDVLSDSIDANVKSLDQSVRRVTLIGRVAFEREESHRPAVISTV